MENKYPQLILKVLELNAEGKSNRHIGKILDLNHRTVSDWLRRNGLESQVARQPIDRVSEFEARCSKCKEVKSITEFQWGRKGQQYEYRFSYCNACRKKQVYLNLNTDHRKRLKDLYNRLKRRAHSTGTEFTLEFQDFHKQWVYQRGRCFYDEAIELDMSVGKGTIYPNSMSVDRMDPTQGYTPENIVFCCYQLNSMKRDASLEYLKKWMPIIYEKITTWKQVRTQALDFCLMP